MAFVQRKGASFNLKYPPLYFRVWNNIALLRNNSNQKATTCLLFMRMALYKLKVPSISSIRPSDLPTFRPPPLAKHTRVHTRCSFVVHNTKVHTKYHLEKQHHHCSGGALAKHARVYTRGFLLVVHDSWWFWCAPNGPPQMSLVHNFDPPRLGETREWVGS